MPFGAKHNGNFHKEERTDASRHRSFHVEPIMPTPRTRSRTRSTTKGARASSTHSRASPSPKRRSPAASSSRGRSSKASSKKRAAQSSDESSSGSDSPAPALPAPVSPGIVKRTGSAVRSSPVTQPASKPATTTATTAKKDDYSAGTNWTAGGVGQGSLFMPLLLIFGPQLCQWLAFITLPKEKVGFDIAEVGVTGLLSKCLQDVPSCATNLFSTSVAILPTAEAAIFLLWFNAMALALDKLLPGKVEYGPETATGHVPDYVDNGIWHSIAFSVLFWGFSNLGFGGLYDFGIIYDQFAPALTCLNIFGLLLSLFLYFKGLYFPSTKDCGSSGSVIVDYVWGTELYPRVLGVDIKRFINCRFSMTFWMLSGLSYAYRSYTLHNNTIDYGLLFAAISQYLYLTKFFLWEIGYMRSIDIIVDRAGFEIQWGCLVWVPSIYTLHSRFSVQHPSELSLPVAATIFVIGMLGVLFNYIADLERQTFRECNGKCKIWGQEPVYVEAQYTVVDRSTGKSKTRKSLLLASGFWGIARHFHYVFELTAAWSWCVLANPLKNGLLPLWYATFLTILLMHRAKRDETKCRIKYGKYYDAYAKMVPYKVIPGIY